MSVFKAGVLTLVVIVVAAYFGFTKANPFANPFELKAMVRDAQNLKSGAPVTGRPRPPSRWSCATTRSRSTRTRR